MLDVRIQRAVSPFVEVAHGAMCDLPESKFLTSRFSQSFASGPFFFSATHGLELFDSSALNRCSNMIHFHYATVKNALLLANVEEYSTAVAEQNLKRLRCSFNVITTLFFFHKKQQARLTVFLWGSFMTHISRLKRTKKLRYTFVSPFIS